METTIIFESVIECVLTVNGEYKGVIFEKGIPLTFDINDKIIIECMPLGNSSYQFFSEKISPKPLSSKNDNFDVIVWNEFCYTIVCKLKKSFKNEPSLLLAETTCANDSTVSLYHNGIDYLLIENEKNIALLKIDFEMQHAEIEEIMFNEKSLIKLTCENGENNFFGLYTNFDTPIALFEGEGKEFKFDSEHNCFYIHKTNLTPLCVESTLTFTFDNSFSLITLSHNVITYAKIVPSNVTRQFVIITFLELIKHNLINVAKSFLSADLQDGFDNETKSFFGNFQIIKQSPLSFDETVISLLSLSQNNIFYPRNFKFEFSNSLISNITEL